MIVRIHTFKDALNRDWAIFVEPTTGTLMLDMATTDGLPLSLQPQGNINHNHLRQIKYYSDAYEFIAKITKQPLSWIPDKITTKEFEV